MDKLQQKIKKSIKNLNPKTKTIFVLENMLWWGLYAIFTLLWAKAFWLLLFILFESNSFWPWLIFWPLWFIIQTFPFFWLISFLLFLSLAFIYTKHTKNAYKIWYWKIIISSIIISIILWTIFHLIGAADREDRFIRWQMPFYDRMMPRCERRWEKENEWKLSWKIISIEWNQINLEDKNLNKWTVNLDNLKEKTNWMFLDKISLWNEIRVLWEKEWDNKFRAIMILPPCENMMMKRWMIRWMMQFKNKDIK